MLEFVCEGETDVCVCEGKTDVLMRERERGS